MRVVVTGGREYTNGAYVYKVLDKLHAKRKITLLVEGGAGGLDTIAGQWADDRGVPRATMNAVWRKYGLAAGAIRNGMMLKSIKPHLLVAFKGNKGTNDCVEQAEEMKIKIKDLRKNE